MGGTFDPIHHGHLVAASEVAGLFGLDEVVFVPTGQPWQKTEREVSPAEDRYLMTVIATASNPRFSVSRVDADRAGPPATIAPPPPLPPPPPAAPPLRAPPSAASTSTARGRRTRSTRSPTCTGSARTPSCSSSPGPTRSPRSSAGATPTGASAPRTRLAAPRPRRPAGELCSVAGAAALAQRRSWRESDRFLRLAHFVGVTRPGFTLADGHLPSGAARLVAIPARAISRPARRHRAPGA